MPVYDIKDIPDKGSLITFASGDIHQTPDDSDKNALLGVVRKQPRTVIDLTATGRIGTRWLAWLGRMTAEAEAGGNKVAVAGADDTTKKTADLIAAQLRHVGTVEEGWKA